MGQVRSAGLVRHRLSKKTSELASSCGAEGDGVKDPETWCRERGSFSCLHREQVKIRIHRFGHPGRGRGRLGGRPRVD